jgi:hypothetical protein
MVLLEDSEASPAHPSVKDSVRVKTVERLEAVGWDKWRGILCFLIDVDV